MEVMKKAGNENAHSQEWLYTDRDSWWNADYLAFRLGTRFPNPCRTILEVGVGRGHWLRALASLARGELEMHGLDREERWVQESRSELSKLPHRYAAFRGEAESLPFADGAYDVVTCQTLLMHLSQPSRALKEMWRVLRPGGSLFVAEPTNVVSCFALTSVIATCSPSQGATLWTLWSCYQRGTLLSLKGDHDIGCTLGQQLEQAGFREIEVFHNDKVFTQRSGDDDFREVLEELRKPHVREMILFGGADDGLIAEADELVAELPQRHRGAPLCNPVSMYLYTCRKDDGGFT